MIGLEIVSVLALLYLALGLGLIADGLVFKEGDLSGRRLTPGLAVAGRRCRLGVAH
jgi:hypothetical protein